MSYERVPSRPDRRLIPPGEAPQVTNRKKKALRDLVEGNLDNKSAEDRATALDFQGIYPGLSLEDINFLKSIEHELDIKGEVLDPKNPESVEAYKLLNNAYQRGKDFLQKTLKYSERSVSIGPDEIKSKKDVTDLLNNTMLVKGPKGRKAPLFCRLVKATIVAYETLRHEAETLEERTTTFEKDLIGSASANKPLILLRENEVGKSFYAAENGDVKGTIFSRPKGFDGILLRFVTRPESNAKKALEDGIASRITIEKNMATELMPILCKWLKDTQGVNPIKIENKDYFSDEEMEGEENKGSVKNKLLTKLAENDFIILKDISNPASGGKFKGIIIKGDLETESEDTMQPSRKYANQFEIQLVAPDNRNEKGRLMDRAIFDIRKRIIARTRLDGRCPERIVDEYINEVSDKPRNKEKIRQSLLAQRDKITKEPYIVKVNSKTGQPYYVANVIIDRWGKIGWIDASLMKEVDSAKLGRGSSKI